MSLVNQVLKDLEHRHASQAQVEALGIEDLHYVPATPMASKKSIKWPIFASILVILGLCTAAGAYLFYAWDNQQNTTQLVVPAPTSAPVVIEKPHTSNEVVSVQPAATTPVVREKAVASAKAVATKKVAEPIVQSAKASIASVPMKKSIPIAEPEPSDSVQKKALPLSPGQRAEMTYQQGYDFISARRYRKAETALRSALALDQGHIKAREMLVGVYISQGRWVEASEILRHGVDIAPQHHTFTKLYARSLMQLKRDQQAIAVLSRNMPAVAQDPEYFAILAALYQRQANHDAAIRTYSDMLKHQPKMGIWWVGMGISLEALGRAQEAVAAYQQARNSGTLNGDIVRYTDNRLLALDAIKYPID